MTEESLAPDEMTEEERGRAARYCFACGSLNPHGLGMQFRIEEGAAVSDFAPAPHHQGYPGLVHGGVVATILDEAMGWAAYGRGDWSMTGRLGMRFRRPVPLGRTLRVEARVTKVRKRFLEVRARLSMDGELLVEADGVFLRVAGDRAEELEALYRRVAGQG